MSQSDNKKIVQYLYDMRVAEEVPMDKPDGSSRVIQEMLAEIRKLGYEWYYMADIDFRSIQNKKVMKILLQYYDDLDLYYKDSLMYKVSPRQCPEVIGMALLDYAKFGPEEKRMFLGFDTVLSKGVPSESYFNCMFDLLEDPNNYAWLSKVRKTLCKHSPERMFTLVEKYSKGILLDYAINDYSQLPYCTDIVKKLQRYADISPDEVCRLASSNEYNLLPYTFEYIYSWLTVDRIRYDAKVALRKIEKKHQDTHTHSSPHPPKKESAATEIHQNEPEEYSWPGPLKHLVDR